MSWWKVSFQAPKYGENAIWSNRFIEWVQQRGMPGRWIMVDLAPIKNEEIASGWKNSWRTNMNMTHSIRDFYSWTLQNVLSLLRFVVQDCSNTTWLQYITNHWHFDKPISGADLFPVTTSSWFRFRQGQNFGIPFTGFICGHSLARGRVGDVPCGSTHLFCFANSEAFVNGIYGRMAQMYPSVRKCYPTGHIYTYIYIYTYTLHVCKYSDIYIYMGTHFFREFIFLRLGIFFWISLCLFYCFSAFPAFLLLLFFCFFLLFSVSTVLLCFSCFFAFSVCFCFSCLFVFLRSLLFCFFAFAFNAFPFILLFLLFRL